MAPVCIHFRTWARVLGAPVQLSLPVFGFQEQRSIYLGLEIPRRPRIWRGFRLVFSKSYRFLKVCLLRSWPQSRLIKHRPTEKSARIDDFFLAWGFQGGISGEWEGSYPVKINSWRGRAKFPSQLPAFWFFFKWQSHTREEMKREIFRLLIRPESPGSVSEPRQGNCRLRSQHCNPRRPCVTGHYISIRNYNHQTTSQLLFWAHMLL